MMRMLRLLVGLLIALAGLQARADFVINNTNLPSTKSNLTAVPVGADPTKYFQALDYNALMNASLDLRTAVMNGKMFGLTPQSSTPNPTTPHSPYSMFVRDSDNDLIYNKNGTLIDIAAGGTASLSSVYAASMAMPGPFIGKRLDLTQASGGIYIVDGSPGIPGDFLDIYSNDLTQQWFAVYNGGLGSFVNQDYSAGSPVGFFGIENSFPAAPGTVQWSPDLLISGRVHDGTASRPTRLQIHVGGGSPGSISWLSKSVFTQYHRTVPWDVLTLGFDGTLGSAVIDGSLQLWNNAAGVCSAGAGCLRFNTGAGHLQFSEAGGAWTNFGSGGGTAIGGAVSGGTPTDVLYVGAGPILAQSTGITLTATQATLPSPIFSGTVTGTYTLGGTLTIASPAITTAVNLPSGVDAVTITATANAAIAQHCAVKVATGTANRVIQMTISDSAQAVVGFAATSAAGAASPVNIVPEGFSATALSDGTTVIAVGDAVEISPNNDCYVRKGVFQFVGTAATACAAVLGCTLTVN